ncbi:MAG: hypothetical protein AAGK09_07600 [Planctomycetota bacterium]
MLATPERQASDPNVIARISRLGDGRLDARGVLAVIRGATTADRPVRAAAPALRVAGHASTPIGVTPAARVLERYLDRLHDRLVAMGDAIDRHDTQAVDGLLQDVAQTSRQHGCRSVCAAAESAREAMSDRSGGSVAQLRRVVTELGELADEVADTARRWTAFSDASPRA